MTISKLLRARGAIIAALVACLALAISACGDDDSDDSAGSTDATTTEEASADTVDVTATEYDFALSADPTADTKTVNFINDGKEFHVLVFAKLNEGFTVDQAIKLQGEKGSAEDVGTVEAQPGETATIDVKKPLVSGDYVMLCPLQTQEGEPHYELGQLAEFAIE